MSDDVLDAALDELKTTDNGDHGSAAASSSGGPSVVQAAGIDWRWAQTLEDATVYVTLPPALAHARNGDFAVAATESTVTLEFLEARLLTWVLHAEAVRKDKAFTLQKLPTKLVLVLELQKKEAAWWPALLNHPLPFDAVYFLTDTEIDAWRKTEAAAPEDDEFGSPEEEEETAEDRALSTEALHARAFDLREQCLKVGDYGARWRECTRLLRVLSLHRQHTPACVALQKWIYESGPAAPHTPQNPSRHARKGFWFLRQAAQAGDRPAQTTLAAWYEEGLPPLSAPSLALAVKWYQRAAAAGCCQAMCGLALLLMKTPSFSTKAVHLAKYALERGSADAHRVHSLWYLDGCNGWPQDLKKAEQRMRAARLVYPEIPDLPYAQLEAEKRKDQDTGNAAAMAAASVHRVHPAEERALARKAAAAPPAPPPDAAFVLLGPRFWETACTVALGAAVVLVVRSMSRT